MKRRFLLVALCTAVAVGGVAALGALGVPVAFALSWAMIVLTIVLVSRQVFFDESSLWPPERARRPERGSEVSRLAWSINSRTGVAGHVVVRRVQNVLRRRLALRGLDLDDPDARDDIDALLGAGVRDALHMREVRADDLERVLDAIERLHRRPASGHVPDPRHAVHRPEEYR
ncbi:hypothetical protein AB0E56_09375 [Microbacterium sp. NPDC028030]|uniref:hypothetical protein n=1 Tax=Microbacterium sp. NPDC028030 TaxID=3155124 RepID=UPI0033E4D673